MATITSANAVLAIGVTSYFPVAQVIQGFATDDAFATSAVDQVETRMGVDGILSGGYIPTAYDMTISLQADSPSRSLFEAWAAQQVSDKEAYVGFGTVLLKSVGRAYDLTKGFLVSYPPMPGVKKVLEPLVYTIRWQNITGAPI